MACAKLSSKGLLLACNRAESKSKLIDRSTLTGLGTRLRRLRVVGGAGGVSFSMRSSLEACCNSWADADDPIKISAKAKVNRFIELPSG